VCNECLSDCRIGPEKLLEVWFSPSASSLPEGAKPYGLKAVSSDTWKEMLDLVNCKVLSIIGHGHMDAYLLSESSMFVFPHKLVLKTCGTTTLLYGLPRMLEIAALEAGFPGNKADLSAGIPAAATPHRVFYSRKNFLYPDQQRGPHRSWRDEVKFLDQRFLGGSAYMIGKMNGEHWYLYITGPNTQLTPPATPERETPTKVLDYPEQLAADMANAQIDESQDETLELLMTDLDEQNARQFYLEDASAIAEGKYLKQSREARKDAIAHLDNIDGDDDVDVFAQTTSDPSEKLTFPEELTTEGHTLGSVVSEACGLADVYPVSKYPEAKIDSYLFTPCGYSANGVVPSTGESGSAHYFTVHVTPEPQCSYASFETNVPARQTGRETRDIVVQVVNIFKPGRFSVTIFEAKTDEDGYGRARVKKDKNMDNIPGYRRVDRIVHDLEGYELVFRYFERLDWKGGAPRLGEYML
jgi:S-adenosylmethionine decarboxylase